MLTTLNVQNLVVVRDVEVEFAEGLTVLTGETGAGKSILIEALSLALGERADSHLIRQGAERAVVSAGFDLSKHDTALKFMRRHALDDGHDCILRRVLTKDGRSRAFCNASPVTVATLRQLGSLLVDIHAQHASQRLLQREHQRRLLDLYGVADGERDDVHARYTAWKKAHDELQALEGERADLARIELLRYQVDELDNANLEADELDTIEFEYKKLANSSTNLEHCAALRATLHDEQTGLVNALDAALASARALTRSVPESANLSAILEQANVAVGEALHELDAIEAGLRTDPERMAELDRRIAELHNLARKHHVELSGLAEVHGRLEAELRGFDRRAEDIEAVRERLEVTRAEYERAAASLTTARERAAKKMNKDITARLRALGIPHGRFAVSITRSSDDTPQPHGCDRVEFNVSTNPDQAPGALGKVASGGELSRITLAIQAATAQHSGVPVAVYDEVDTGIGGTTANIVGHSLRDVARHNQVICITHSPQVASAGDNHLLVDKNTVGGRAETTLKPLDKRAREVEIARMLGAPAKTRSSIAHARDLIASARS